MVAGLPGTGIGGIFYLMSSLCMPIRELLRLRRGKSSVKRWKFIFKQWTLTAGIIFGFWVTGLVLALMIPVKVHGNGSVVLHHTNVFKFAPLFITLGVLTAVLIVVELLQFVVSKPRSKRTK